MDRMEGKGGAMRQRSPWVVVMVGVLALVCVVTAGVAGYWRYANELPVYPALKVVIPVPNAYDDFVAAGQLCEAAGGAAVTPSGQGPAMNGRSAGPPGSSSFGQREAFE